MTGFSRSAVTLQRGLSSARASEAGHPRCWRTGLHPARRAPFSRSAGEGSCTDSPLSHAQMGEGARRAGEGPSVSEGGSDRHRHQAPRTSATCDKLALPLQLREVSDVGIGRAPDIENALSQEGHEVAGAAQRLHVLAECRIAVVRRIGLRPLDLDLRVRPVRSLRRRALRRGDCRASRTLHW